MKLDVYVEEAKCVYCGKTFIRSKRKKHNGQRKLIGVKNCNVVTCSRECSKHNQRRHKIHNT